MKRSGSGIGIFISLFLLSLLLFFFSQKNILGGFGILGNGLFPLQAVVFQLVRVPAQMTVKPQEQKVLQKTLDTAEKAVDVANLQKDNAALRDQFATSETQNYVMVPSHVIGAPQFLPGVGVPDSIVIDQGTRSGIKVGQAVVYKNNVVGTITQVRSSAALVKLVSSNGVSFPAKTNGTNALGVLKGTGNGTMVIDNVVLSDELKVGDLIVSAMGQNLDGTGYPPGLIIGKITSIEKNPSNLFQRASVQSLVNVTKIADVFVITGTK